MPVWIGLVGMIINASIEVIKLIIETHKQAPETAKQIPAAIKQARIDGHADALTQVMTSSKSV